MLQYGHVGLRLTAENKDIKDLVKENHPKLLKTLIKWGLHDLMVSTERTSLACHHQPPFMTLSFLHSDYFNYHDYHKTVHHHHTGLVWKGITEAMMDQQNHWQLQKKATGSTLFNVSPKLAKYLIANNHSHIFHPLAYNPTTSGHLGIITQKGTTLRH